MLWFGLVFDSRHKPHRAEHRHHRRASVAEERQRYADDRRNADAHTDVADKLEHQRRSRSKAHHAAHIVRAADTNMNAADDAEELMNYMAAWMD